MGDPDAARRAWYKDTRDGAQFARNLERFRTTLGVPDDDVVLNDLLLNDGLRLSSSCLLSKWGFANGDLVDAADDEMVLGRATRVAVLVRLVREWLLPALAANHLIEIYEIDTTHNPIRAESVDGVKIDAGGDNDHIVLTPEYVDVPPPAVAAVIAAYTTVIPVNPGIALERNA